MMGRCYPSAPAAPPLLLACSAADPATADSFLHGKICPGLIRRGHTATADLRRQETSIAALPSWSHAVEGKATSPQPHPVLSLDGSAVSSEAPTARLSRPAGAEAEEGICRCIVSSGFSLRVRR
jgi:hypothetical protein